MKMHDDGWLKLSPALLRALNAKSGDKLEVELKDGTLVLRPVDGKARASDPKVVVSSPAEPAPSEGRSSRQRSSDNTGSSAPSVVLPSGRRAGGRKPRPGG